MIRSVVLSVGICFAAAAFAGNAQHAHVHDAADLTIAQDSPNRWSVEFDAPTQVVYGFEHESRNAAEKAQEKGGIKQMQEKMREMVILPNNAGCHWQTLSVKIDKHKEGSGVHRDLEANYHVECASPLKGSVVHFAFQKFFPSLKHVNVQVLTDNGQYKQPIQSTDDTLEIK